MSPALIVLTGFMAMLQPPPGGQADPPQPSHVAGDCAGVLSPTAGPALIGFCGGEQELGLADALPKEAPKRTLHLQAAADHYRKAADLVVDPSLKARALDRLADVYGRRYLNDLHEAELALRELVTVTPTDLKPMFRLARVQEEEELIDAAEATFLAVRHRYPEAIEPNQELARFYVRRVTAIERANASSNPILNPPAPGEPDENGVYRVGGSLPPPAKVADVAPRYPPEALRAHVEGVVVAEVTIDEFGRVRDASIVRSIPILDGAALEAVLQWRFAPTIISGHAVPVKATVTVNFTQARQ